MRTVAEYRQNAEECRNLAKGLTKPDDKDALEQMAQTWDRSEALPRLFLIFVRVFHCISTAFRLQLHSHDTEISTRYEPIDATLKRFPRGFICVRRTTRLSPKPTVFSSARGLRAILQIGFLLVAHYRQKFLNGSGVFMNWVLFLDCQMNGNSPL